LIYVKKFITHRRTVRTSGVSPRRCLDGRARPRSSRVLSSCGGGRRRCRAALRLVREISGQLGWMPVDQVADRIVTGMTSASDEDRVGGSGPARGSDTCGGRRRGIGTRWLRCRAGWRRRVTGLWQGDDEVGPTVDLDLVKEVSTHPVFRLAAKGGQSRPQERPRRLAPAPSRSGATNSLDGPGTGGGDNG
jgi:hypothetical protein